MALKIDRTELHLMLKNYNASMSKSSIESICEGAPYRVIGEVVNVEDDTYQCRIKCQIDGVTRSLDTGKQIEDDDLPWCYASPVMMNMFDAPIVGDYVELDMSKGIYDMRWNHLDSRSDVARALLGDENEKVKVLVYDQTRRYDENSEPSDGIFGIWWSPERGWNIEYNGSRIEIRKDKSIYLHCNSETERFGTVHLTKDGKISLGSEDKSAQPAVLGNSNQEELELIHKTLDNLVNNMDTLMQELSTTSSSNPYTSPLSPVFKKHTASVKQPFTQDLQKCVDKLPALLSAIVTVDEGLEDDGYDKGK